MVYVVFVRDTANMQQNKQKRESRKQADAKCVEMTSVIEAYCKA
jgi:hypothetical protein